MYFFSECTWIISMRGHMLGHMTTLSKFKQAEIMSGNFSKHHTMRLEISYKGKEKMGTSFDNIWSLVLSS